MPGYAVDTSQLDVRHRGGNHIEGSEEPEFGLSLLSFRGAGGISEEMLGGHWGEEAAVTGQA